MCRSAFQHLGCIPEEEPDEHPSPLVLGAGMRPVTPAIGDHHTHRASRVENLDQIKDVVSSMGCTHHTPHRLKLPPSLSLSLSRARALSPSLSLSLSLSLSRARSPSVSLSHSHTISLPLFVLSISLYTHTAHTHTHTHSRTHRPR